jgi:hypothetical protein
MTRVIQDPRSKKAEYPTQQVHEVAVQATFYKWQKSPRSLDGLPRWQPGPVKQPVNLKDHQCTAEEALAYICEKAVGNSKRQPEKSWFELPDAEEGSEAHGWRALTKPPPDMLSRFGIEPAYTEIEGKDRLSKLLARMCFDRSAGSRGEKGTSRWQVYFVWVDPQAEACGSDVDDSELEGASASEEAVPVRRKGRGGRAKAAKQKKRKGRAAARELDDSPSSRRPDKRPKAEAQASEDIDIKPERLPSSTRSSRASKKSVAPSVTTRVTRGASNRLRADGVDTVSNDPVSEDDIPGSVDALGRASSSEEDAGAGLVSREKSVDAEAARDENESYNLDSVFD